MPTPRSDVRIFLTGFMGAGKTVVGRSLAAALDKSFIDLDSEIERRAAMTVREIFECLGEAAFRRLEYDALAAAADVPDVVVATGGGTIVFDNCRELIRASGVSVWLNPPFSIIARRIGGLGKEDRPLFRNEAQALELYRQRVSAYRRADLQIDVGAEETPEEVAARIALRLGELKCAT